MWLSFFFFFLKLWGSLEASLLLDWPKICFQWKNLRVNFSELLVQKACDSLSISPALAVWWGVFLQLLFSNNKVWNCLFSELEYTLLSWSVHHCVLLSEEEWGYHQQISVPCLGCGSCGWTSILTTGLDHTQVSLLSAHSILCWGVLYFLFWGEDGFWGFLKK